MTSPSSSWIKVGIGLVLTGVGVAALSIGGSTAVSGINEIVNDPSYVEIKNVLSHIKTAKGVARGLADISVGSLNIQYKILQLQKLFDLPYSDAKLLVQYSIQTGYKIPCVHELDVMSTLQNDPTAINDVFDLNENNSQDLLPVSPSTTPPGSPGGTTLRKAAPK
jgi:hypothetical protein